MDQQSKSGTLDRRDVLRAAGVLAAGAALGSLGACAQGRATTATADAGASGRRRVLRVAHMTDTHVQRELKGDEGLAACLRHAQSLKDKPDLILTGGDQVFDAYDQGEGRARELFTLWQRVCRDECSIPMEHCIGNHDIWGWNRSRSKTSGSEANYGKKWAMEVFGLTSPYRSFDRAGWHFVVLDSVQHDPENPDGYIAGLDDEQFEWLKQDLSRVPAGTPTLVLSHIPIISATALFESKEPKSIKRSIPAGWMFTDAMRVKNLFAQHPTVKLCISGHMHLVDRVDLSGVTYLCNGAVSGAWWKGKHQDCVEGYALLDLYSDGKAEWTYMPYGWQAKG